MSEQLEEFDGNAESFLIRHNLEFKCEFLKHDYYFHDDSNKRDIYRLSIIRKDNRRKKLSIIFGNNLLDSARGIAPIAYDLLACLTKYDPDSFDTFCSDYGYSIETVKDLNLAKTYYKNVCKEWKKVSHFFTEAEFDDLREIL